MKPVIINLKRLWGHISSRRRLELRMVLILMVLTSFLEILSIGSVIPFLAVLTSPASIFEMSGVQPFIQFMGLNKPEQLIFPITIMFSLFTLIASFMRVLLLYANTRLSFAVGTELSLNIYRRTLYQSYSIHCERNSSEIISAVSNKANGTIFTTIIPFLSLASSISMIVLFLLTLLVSQLLIILTGLSVIGLIYVFIIIKNRKEISNNSQVIALETTEIIKALQEGLGGIRDILIDGTQPLYCEIYRKADLSLRQAQASSLFISSSPRIFLETLAIISISTLAYFYCRYNVNGISNAIPILGALALSAQRLLPIMQQAFASWIQINNGLASLEDTLDFLDQSLPDFDNNQRTPPLAFKKNISFSQVSFRYSKKTPYVLKNVNFNIVKGERIGFIGATGSGKSTLLDIIMGLLDATDGTFKVDDLLINSSNKHSWQSHIAHVPQNIYLTDSSIKENIAFGVPRKEINMKLVQRVAKQALIGDTIESLPDKYETVVGEQGIRLSGGQRQRIGIARALYKKTDLIIFDEATNSLDNDTEESVMKEIEKLSPNLTILIVAHRLSTLKNCDKIFELRKGKVKAIGTYQDIVLS